MQEPNGERNLIDHFTRRLAYAAVLVTACSGGSTSGGSAGTGSAGTGSASTGGAGTGSAGTGGATSGAGGQAGSTDIDAGGDAASGNRDAGRTDTGAAGDAFTSGDGQVAGTCSPPDDIYKPIEKLSLTGCVDPRDPKVMSARAVPYEVNSPLWSDNANKTRAFVLPAGGKIHVKNCTATPGECPQGAADDGKWVFPVGTVMIKNFIFDGKLVETRLFMRMSDDAMSGWVGYGYEWNEAQTEATVAPDSRDMGKQFNTGSRTVTWSYPSRMDCIKCHDPKGGSTLGPETAQMNRMIGAVNQLDTLAALKVFETAPAKPYEDALVAPYDGQAGAPPAGATIDQKARSYMHANCAFCHRPEGQFPNFDLRSDTALVDRKICNVATKKPVTGIASNVIFVPGDHAGSALWQRMHELDPDKGRMPAIGSYVVDDLGTQVIADWIDSIKACP